MRRCFLSWAVLVALPLHAQTSLFVCKTKGGHTYSGPFRPPECPPDVPIRELNPDGSTKRIIPPVETPEQRGKREEAETKQRELEKRGEAQRRNDRRLLQSYETEDDIEKARGRALADPMRQIERAKQRSKELDADRKRLSEEAEFYTKRKLPEHLQRSLDDNAEQRAAQDRAIQAAKAEMEGINDRFDEDLRRFRELVKEATSATPPEGGSGR
jgi:hypothetical protein